MNSLKTELLNTKLFHGISLSENDLDMAGGSILKLAPLQRVFEQGDRRGDVYFLIKGRLLAVHWTRDGREVLFSRIEEGDSVGEIAAIDGGDRSLSVYAQKDSIVVAMPRNGFLRLLATHSDLALRVMQNLTALVRRLTERAYQTSTMTVEERVKMCLVRIAMDARALHNFGEITDAPTHSEIASLIGANREAVSRAMSALKKSGTIEGGRGHIRLIDPEILLKDLVS